MSRARVVILRTAPDRVQADYQRLIDLLDPAFALKCGHANLLVPDLSWDRFLPTTCSPPWQLECTARALAARGHHAQTLVLAASPAVSIDQAARAHFYPTVVQRLHLETRRQGQLADFQRMDFEPITLLPALKHLAPRGLSVPAFMFRHNLVLLPTFRTHAQLRFTGAARLLSHLLLTASQQVAARRDPHPVLFELLQLVSEIAPCQLYVCDATTVGEGPGPRAVRLLEKNLLIGTNNPWALDLVLSHLQGLSPSDVPHLQLGIAAGLAPASLDDLDIVGLPIHDLQLRLATTDPLFPPVQQWQDGLLKTVAHRVPRAVLGNLHRLAGHPDDALWYAARGRGEAARWLASPWGKLFAQYSPSAS